MKKALLLVCTSILAVGIFFSAQNSVADYNFTELQPEIYKLDKETDYKADSKKRCTNSDKKPIGSLKIEGDYNSKNVGSNAGVVSYPINGNISIKYSFEDDYEVDTYKNLIDNKDKWFIVSDNAKVIDGYSINEKINSGGILVLLSADGKNYAECSHSTDVFKNKFVDEDLITLKDRDCPNGLYVRIYVSYRLKHRVNDKYVMDDYVEYRYLEKYDLFLYDESPISIYDINNVVPGKELKGMSSVSNGFTVYKNGFSGKVSVQKPDGKTIKIDDGQSFSEPGKYVVWVKDGLFKDYKKTITINDGMVEKIVDPIVYELKDSQGYDERKGRELDVNEKTVFSDRSHTRLIIGSYCKTGTHNGIVGYGTYGHELKFYLTYNQNENGSYNGWSFCSDDWGNDYGETVSKDAITVGTVGSGALIVQYSEDGEKWSAPQSNTDFSKNYKTVGKTMISSPSGEKVIEGQYCRIYYAYEIKNGNQIKNYLEKYEFYICYDDLNAIVFNNLSFKNRNEDSIEYDTAGISSGKSLCNSEVLFNTETLVDGDYTVSGFKFKNQISGTNYKVNAEIKIRLNGVPIEVNDGHEYTDEGKYEITLTSNIGTKKQLTIYVDKRTDEAKKIDYFGGNEFVCGKRIYSEMYPTFEAGDLNIELNKPDSNHKLLTGKVWNTDTNEILFNGKIKSCSITIENKGHYRAEFTTANSLDSDDLSGDVWTFSSVFDVIEKGTVPGPVINQEKLRAHNISSVLGGKLVYYGVAVKTAGEGKIIYLFDSDDDALQFAIKYEHNRIVPDPDGKTWKYDEVIYYSVEEANEKADENAKHMVKKRYIDPNQSQTYCTLSEKTLNDYQDKLNTLQIAYNAFLFAENQKEKFVDVNRIPIINDWNIDYVNPEGSLNFEPVYSPFFFVKDPLEIDSSKITITDLTGSKIIEDVKYRSSVQAQLEEADFDTGVITIEEETKYGDPVIYNALYFKPGENNTVYTVEIIKGDETQSLNISQETVPKDVIETKGFCIKSVNDEYDPYGLVRVVKDGEEIFFCMTSDDVNRTWYNEGEYTITCTNCCGSSYEYHIRVLPSDVVTVNVLSDEGVKIDSFEVKKGDRNCELPKYDRTGYILAGFENASSGEKYKDQISDFGDCSSIDIKPIWEPKKITITYYDENNQKIRQDSVLYDSEYEFIEYMASDEKCSFSGWTSDGTSIYRGKVVISCDEDLELRPVLTEKMIVAETSTMETSNDTEPVVTASDQDVSNGSEDHSESSLPFKTNKLHIVFIGIGIVVVAVLISSVILIKERSDR